MGRIVFEHARVFDGTSVLPEGTTVVVEEDRITQVTRAPVETGPDDVVHDLFVEPDELGVRPHRLREAIEPRMRLLVGGVFLDAASAVFFSAASFAFAFALSAAAFFALASACACAWACAWAAA